MPGPTLAITPGEPAGIGPEIVLKYRLENPGATLVAVADPGLLRETANALDLPVTVETWRPGIEPASGTLACLPVSLACPAQPGEPDPRNAPYVLETLRAAHQLVRSKQAAALVTGPVHKGVINDAGIAFSGHTEFLAGLADGARVVMMLATPGLRVTLVTTHLPLKDVAAAVTAQNVEHVIRTTHDALKRQFGIERPRLQVLGLNPHAGEGGHLGREDADIIEPVIGKLAAAGMDLLGPVPADTAFNPDRIAACDAVVAMYHDQGLPVLKHLGFGNAVNVTLGLPFIRTSVDHGTALDLAGSGKADTGSLHRAVQTACEMARHHDETT